MERLGFFVILTSRGVGFGFKDRNRKVDSETIKSTAGSRMSKSLNPVKIF